jgi:hypothetical protein
MRWLRALTVRSRPCDGVFLSSKLHAYLCDNSIVRAFLIEEAKVVKRVIKSQQKAASGRS